MIAANADSYRQIGPQSSGLIRDEIIRNMMGDVEMSSCGDKRSSKKWLG
jgi:hypothetical protein